MLGGAKVVAGFFSEEGGGRSFISSGKTPGVDSDLGGIDVGLTNIGGI